MTRLFYMKGNTLLKIEYIQNEIWIIILACQHLLLLLLCGIKYRVYKQFHRKVTVLKFMQSFSRYYKKVEDYYIVSSYKKETTLSNRINVYIWILFIIILFTYFINGLQH